MRDDTWHVTFVILSCVLFDIGATIPAHQENQCLLYAGFKLSFHFAPLYLTNFYAYTRINEHHLGH